MSEQDNVDVVRKGYEAFGRGDIDGLLAAARSGCRVADAGAGGSADGGRAARPRRGSGILPDPFAILDIQRFEPKQFIAQGDMVMVIGDDTSRVKATGTTMEFRFVHAFTVRNGKVVAFEEYLDVSPLVAELRGAQART